MQIKNRWLLPDGVQETLPPDAQAVENLRHCILQTYARWGYDLVMPALVEYIDSLLTGTAHSLDQKTFTLVDQLSGKQMGIRSDMTPQVARIDAHLLADSMRQHRVTRLCYCGHLLHAQGDGITASRTPLQIGAEIFGNATVAADVEVASLMIETLHIVGLEQISIDIGHVGIFRSLVQATALSPEQENRLFNMLQRKSTPELKLYLQQLSLSEKLQEQFHQLALLNGDVAVLEEARLIYADCHDELFQALDHMQAAIEQVKRKYPTTLIHCDLSELRGYSYHTGLVFSAFLPGHGKEIARGGRYDAVGRVFGNARLATGFSTDLLSLYQLSNQIATADPGILAPDSDDPQLEAMIKDLRRSNQAVIVDLTAGKCSASEQRCNRVLLRQGDGWVIQEVPAR